MAIDVIFTAIGAWLIQNYAKEMTDKSVGSAKGKVIERWKTFGWRNAAKKYEENLRRHHAKIRILGKSDPIPLAGIFTDVYILDELTARKRYSIEELSGKLPDQLQHSTGKRQSGLELVKQLDPRQLYIAGKPGSGKTTFLRHLTLKAIDGEFDQVPIFISLKEWSETDLTLMNFIAKQFEICHFPEATPFIERLLDEGQALVMFDGLDEVSQEGGQRSKLITDLTDFSKQYYDCKILITCRVAASEYEFPQFQDIEIADFTKAQIRAFVEKWFQDAPQKGEVFIEELYFKVENRPLSRLATVPLLLSFLCLTFEDRMSFPRRRTDLYEKALDALLRGWDASRNIERDKIYKNLSRPLKQRMFAHIGAKTFEQGHYFIRQGRLEKQIGAYLKNLAAADPAPEIDGRAILKAIEAQHGIFIEWATGIYAFSHPTFQEYYTAKHIADHETTGATKRLIRRHLTDNRWREVFIFTAGLLDEADAFFRLFRQAIDDLIAADEDLVKLLRWIKEEAAATTLPYKPAAVRSVYLFLFATRKFELNRETLSTLHLFAQALHLAVDLAPDFGSELSFSVNRDHDRGYTQLAVGIRRTLYQNLDLARAPNFDLSVPHTHLLAAYLQATHLLLNCLDGADFVSNRREIEDGLLLPPKRSKESSGSL